MSDYVLGIDIGGTSIKAGLFSPEGEILGERKIPTPALVEEMGFQMVTSGLTRLLSGYDAKMDQVIACGVDIPAPVAADGSVSMTANVELDPDGLVHALQDAMPNAIIACVNDANAATVGEMWRGAAHGVSDFVMIAIGTGLRPPGLPRAVRVGHGHRAPLPRDVQGARCHPRARGACHRHAHGVQGA